MQSRWSEAEAERCIREWGPTWGEDLALRTYSARLLGAEPALVLHGGGNTSVKTMDRDVFGTPLAVLRVKASGFNLATLEPAGHVALELAPLQRLRSLEQLSDERMVGELRRGLLDWRSPNPSIEALVHAFIPARFIDHTHADAILVLTNQEGGEERVREALGDNVIILDYVEPGFELARAMAQAVEGRPAATAAVWMRHGVITWGETARDAYERMIGLVCRAEQYLERHAPVRVRVLPGRVEEAANRLREVAPVLRGVLAEPTGDEDRPWEPGIVRWLADEKALSVVESEWGRELASTPPVTADHLIRTGSRSLWVEAPLPDDVAGLRAHLSAAVEAFRRDYREYVSRFGGPGSADATVAPAAGTPRVIFLPGCGIACLGPTLADAEICRDITRQTLEIKQRVRAIGRYRGLTEERLFQMEFRGLQQAKLARRRLPLEGRTALITGAAGAIGAGICRRLLAEGACVMASDIDPGRLEQLVAEFRPEFGSRIGGQTMDVTDPASVAAGFRELAAEWGGVDLVAVNAGIALVCSLAEMSLEAFRRLERVNVEGTLLVLAEAARHFQRQGIGGDIVLISTKNVFAPGARFGAYSATKAGAHQLARIASLELAEMGVRVNMVAPDAVFAEGRFKSGLWAEVGPDRMRARGLDESQLQEYYRSRNLLKSRVTAGHVANAVLFFATRQTPTTGATIPVDGGLPDATPR